MRSRAARFALALCFVAINGYSAECSGCHPAETRAHARTAHAGALVRAADSTFAAHLPSWSLAEAADGYMFKYEQTPVGLIAIAEKGSTHAEGLIQWVFGSGRRGQTPMLTSHNRFREHRVSFYAEGNTYGITTGQANGVSANAEKALGALQTDAEVRSCFGCHTTGLKADVTRFTPGVQCERCHAGAEEHAGGQGRPVNPGKLQAADQVRLCGTCHRVTAPNGDDNDLSNVRFQPLRLMKSRCFLEGKAACTTCHAAHRDALRGNDAYYDARCQSCHAAQEKHVAEQKSGDCVSCHMPRSRPHPSLEFTDHFIRVIARQTIIGK